MQIPFRDAFVKIALFLGPANRRREMEVERREVAGWGVWGVISCFLILACLLQMWHWAPDVALGSALASQTSVAVWFSLQLLSTFAQPASIHVLNCTSRSLMWTTSKVWLFLPALKFSLSPTPTPASPSQDVYCFLWLLFLIDIPPTSVWATLSTKSILLLKSLVWYLFSWLDLD